MMALPDVYCRINRARGLEVSSFILLCYLFAEVHAVFVCAAGMGYCVQYTYLSVCMCVCMYVTTVLREN